MTVTQSRRRGPRRETVVERFADIPETPAQERARRLAERRAILGARNAERKRRENQERVVAAVAWIEPVPIKPGSRITVCGVCSDASDEVKREYGVAV